MQVLDKPNKLQFSYLINVRKEKIGKTEEHNVRHKVNYCVYQITVVKDGSNPFVCFHKNNSTLLSIRHHLTTLLWIFFLLQQALESFSSYFRMTLIRFCFTLQCVTLIFTLLNSNSAPSLTEKLKWPVNYFQSPLLQLSCFTAVFKSAAVFSNESLSMTYNKQVRKVRPNKKYEYEQA